MTQIVLSIDWRTAADGWPGGQLYLLDLERHKVLDHFKQIKPQSLCDPGGWTGFRGVFCRNGRAYVADADSIRVFDVRRGQLAFQQAWTTRRYYDIHDIWPGPGNSWCARTAPPEGQVSRPTARPSDARTAPAKPAELCRARKGVREDVSPGVRHAAEGLEHIYRAAGKEVQMKVDYELVDAQQLHREHPDTFDVPPRDSLAGLTAGDYVKVIFKVTNCPSAPSGCSGERMWIKLQSCGMRAAGPGHPYRLYGYLANDPVYLREQGVHYGTTIYFWSSNVIDILRGEEETP